jgi:hypothetical protein
MTLSDNRMIAEYPGLGSTWKPRTGGKSHICMLSDPTMGRTWRGAIDRPAATPTWLR